MPSLSESGWDSRSGISGSQLHRRKTIQWIFLKRPLQYDSRVLAARTARIRTCDPADWASPAGLPPLGPRPAACEAM